MTPTRGRREAIEKALRSFDWIDVGNHPGDDEQYAAVADAIEAAVAADAPELERLRSAWLDAGPRPDVHDAAQRKLRSEWPTLHDALVALFGGFAR